MKIGERLVVDKTLTSDNMIFLKQLGVNQLMVLITDTENKLEEKPSLSSLKQDNFYQVQVLTELKDWVESHGLELFGISDLNFKHWDKIILGLSGREEQIENWRVSLRNMGEVGIPLLQYNWMINTGCRLPLWRTFSEATGRGGTTITEFDYAIEKNAPVTEFGEVSEHQMWDNLTYFLKAIMPVAEQFNVKLVMHPADPQVPVLAGIARIIRSTEAYDRLFEIAPGDYNSMVFCLGCFAQMYDPDDVYSAIKHFGGNNRIAYVDFRNVIGNRDKFAEVYPDEGKLDMFKALKTLKEVGFTGQIVPDHAPLGIGDTLYRHRSRAYQIGYLKGLLQSLSALE